MSTPKNFDLFDCQHTISGSNCKVCGVHISGSIQAYKTYRYICQHDDSNPRYLRSLKHKNQKAKILPTSLPQSKAIYEYLQAIVDKFEFSIETFALGIYLYNHLIGDDSERSEYVTEMEFYAGLCLMIAAKAVELDRHIPYYSRYLKYACKRHSSDEYEKAEVKLIQEFQWNLQRPTFVTFLNFYLSNGVVFSDQEFSRKKVFLVEEKVKENMVNAMKKGDFVLSDQEILAAKIVDQSRKEFKLLWHPSLEKYSGMAADMFQEVSILKPLNMDLQETPYKSPKISNNSCSTQPTKDFLLSIGSEKKDFGSHLKIKRKPIIRPMQPPRQLRKIPSFSGLRLLTKTQSNPN